MLNTLAVYGYRSLRDVVIPLDRLNLVTGPNGSGKSNLYRALRMLAETAQGGVIPSLAKEGGLQSTLWAGPETISRSVKRGDHPVEGGGRQKPVSLRLGFAGEDFSYAIDLGLPVPPCGAFGHDPEIKRECVWAGRALRPSAVLVDRRGPLVKAREVKGEWAIVTHQLASFDSMMTHCADPRNTPELLMLREEMRAWRFYDHFRTDAAAPARVPQIGTHTPVLSHDGADLAAALQTIREIGDGDALDRAIDDAFAGARVSVSHDSGRFDVTMQQHGLLRPLRAAELSDGTLRYLLWIAALLTPRPPGLLVLNEPETSLHPDLLPALGRLIALTSARSQVVIVSHAHPLIDALQQLPDCRSITLEKQFGETRVVGRAGQGHSGSGRRGDKGHGTRQRKTGNWKLRLEEAGIMTFMLKRQAIPLWGAALLGMASAFTIGAVLDAGQGQAPAAPQPATTAPAQPAAARNNAAAQGAVRNAEGAIIGFTALAEIPGTAWRIHDIARPHPRVITPGAAPGSAPSDAIVLFDGKDLSKWQHSRNGRLSDATWPVRDGYFETGAGSGSIVTREKFGDVQLHVEFATPSPGRGSSQDRGNSGVIFMGRYEVQVLDSYENVTYADGQAAAIYGEYPPLVNVARKPGEWQTYDIVFEAPKFNGPTLLAPAYITVFWNGVLVQHRRPVMGPTSATTTQHSYTPHDPELPLTLQDHSHPVHYRNIWVRRLGGYDLPEAPAARARREVAERERAGVGPREQ